MNEEIKNLFLPGPWFHLVLPFKTNHQLNCDDRCIINLLTCKQYQKQYTQKLRMILDIDGTITSPILESLIGKSLACKNAFTDTLVAQVTWDSLMMY